MLTNPEDCVIIKRMARKILVTINIFVVFFGLGEPLFAKKKHEDIAHYFMDIMNYEDAVFYYKQALEDTPKRKEIKDKLGYAYFKLGRVEDALKALREEMLQYPSNLNALILLCFIHYRRGEMGEAVRFYDRFHRAFQMVLQREKKKLARKYRLTETNLKILAANLRQMNPNLGLPYFIRGLHNKQEGRTAEALNDFARALEAGYDPVQCSLQNIDISLSKKKWQEAILFSRDAQRVSGEMYEWYFVRGYAQYRNGQPADAAFSFLEALELKPCDVEATRNLALLYIHQRETEKALPLFRRILKLVPYDYDIKFQMDRLESGALNSRPEKIPALTKKAIEEAVARYHYLFQTDVDIVINDINYKTIALLRSGKIDLATAFLQSFLERDDRSPGLNYNLAQFYSMKNDLGKALRYTLRAVDLRENFKEAYDLGGSLFLKLEDYDHSIRFYQKVIELDPKDAVGHYNLGCALSANNDFLKAEESWKRAMELDRNPPGEKEEESYASQLQISVLVEERPVSFNCHRALGELYANQDRKEEALEQYLVARELEPRNADVHYEIGKLHLRLDDPHQAVRFFEDYLALGGKREGEVKKILNDIKKSPST